MVLLLGGNQPGRDAAAHLAAGLKHLGRYTQCLDKKSVVVCVYAYQKKVLGLGVRVRHMDPKCLSLPVCSWTSFLQTSLTQTVLTDGTCGYPLHEKSLK